MQEASLVIARKLQHA